MFREIVEAKLAVEQAAHDLTWNCQVNLNGPSFGFLLYRRRRKILQSNDRTRPRVSPPTVNGQIWRLTCQHQADCYAGVWAFHANQQFKIAEQGDVENGLRAASSVGDDALQRQSQGEVVPDSFTHGCSDQRVRWFKRGLAHGNMDECETLSADQL